MAVGGRRDEGEGPIGKNGLVALEQFLHVGGGCYQVGERKCRRGAVGHVHHHVVRVIPSLGRTLPRKEECLAGEGAPDERLETVEEGEVETAVPEPVAAGVERLVEGDEIAGADGGADGDEDVGEAGGFGPGKKKL